MTREPVWQDDPPFTVGKVAKVEPATDEQISMWEDDMDGTPWSDGHIGMLIARIKDTEQKLAVMTSSRDGYAKQDAARSQTEREQTIRECAEIARAIPHLRKISRVHVKATTPADVADELLSLLQSKGDDKSVPLAKDEATKRDA